MRSVIENTESGNFNSPDVKLSWHGPDKDQREVYFGGEKRERETVWKPRKWHLELGSLIPRIIFSAKY